jgi:hypothetical protein
VLLYLEAPEWQVSSTPPVDLALAKLELEISLAKAAVAASADVDRPSLQEAFDAVADACQRIGVSL